MGTHDGGRDLDELASSSRSLAKRLRGLAQAARTRQASPQFVKAITDAHALTEAAADAVDNPAAPIPTLSREGLPTKSDPRSVARHMTDALSQHPDAPGGKNEIAMSDLAPAVVLRGRCDAISVSELLEFLGHIGKTGVLWVKAKGETFTIQMEEGFVVNAFSDNTPREHLLGNILLEQNSITEGQLEMFLQSFTRFSGHIGQALEKDKLVSQEQLAAALERQVYLLFQRIAASKRATFTFSEGTTGTHDRRVRLSVVQLVLESARAQDEADRV
jgi:hypothetical protein